MTSFTRKIKAGLVKVDYTGYVGETGTLFTTKITALCELATELRRAVSRLI